jgi:hypothetical protein
MGMRWKDACTKPVVLPSQLTLAARQKRMRATPKIWLADYEFSAGLLEECDAGRAAICGLGCN